MGSHADCKYRHMSLGNVYQDNHSFPHSHGTGTIGESQCMAETMQISPWGHKTSMMASASHGGGGDRDAQPELEGMWAYWPGKLL